MATWGDILLRSAARARKCAILIAPYIKEHALRHILNAIAADVSVCVVTRWRPDEVASGVSDLTVLDLLDARPGSKLLLFSSLHAKYYRFDGSVLVGSANLTGAALGWSPSPNLELLVETPWPAPELESLESLAIQGSVRATRDIQAAVLLASQAFERVPQEIPSPSTTSAGDVFLPRTRNPEILYRAYASPDPDLTAAATEQTDDDLRALSLPAGLSQEQFRAVVGSLLLQSPVVAFVDEMATSPRRFGEARHLLREHLAQVGVDRDVTETWQTLMRWLTYFLPGRYEVFVPRFSEVFGRRSGDGH